MPTMARKAISVKMQLSIPTELLEYHIPIFPCKSDKSPFTTNGFKDASTDEDQIEQWSKQYPDALVGVPTGHISQLLVVDIDPDGKDWYVKNYERAEAGRIHVTPRGHHLVYRMPDADIRCSTSKLAPGVDVRANGGYFIWWPQQGLDVVGTMDDIADPPHWLPTALTVKPSSSDSKIPNGQRNDTLTSLAGKLRQQGKDELEIAESLLTINKLQCCPPLPDNEVKSIAKSIARYSVDDGIDDVGMIEDGDPLLPVGNYVVRYNRHRIFRNMHGYGPKIVVWFAITEGNYKDTVVRTLGFNYQVQQLTKPWF